MHIIPFFNSAIYAIQAYLGTFPKIRVVQNAPDGESELFKGTAPYELFVKTVPGSMIKSNMEGFLTRISIREDLIILEKRNPGFCMAEGTNSFKKGDAVIFVAPNFSKVDEKACHWLIKHEISHIKNDDLLTMPLVACSATLVAGVISGYTMTVLPATLVTYLVGIGSLSMYSLYREGKADDLANNESSVEELKGGRRFILSVKKANQEQRRSFLQKLLVTDSGDHRINILHPSLSSRVKKIELKLLEKKVKINQKEEDKKINKLKDFFIDTVITVQEEIKRLGKFDHSKAMHKLSV